VLDDLVRRAEDRVRRAVVLLERDLAGLAEVALELEDVADVGAPEGVDGVVRDQTVGDEVVRALDVEVVDRLVESDRFDVCDKVELAGVVHHQHPRTNGGRGHEGQRIAVLAGQTVAAGKTGGVAHRNAERLSELVRNLGDSPQVCMGGFVAPAVRAPVRGTNGKSKPLEDRAALIVVPEQRDTVKRAGPPRIAAEGNAQPPTDSTAIRRGCGTEVWMRERQTLLLEKLPTRAFRIELRKQSVEQRLVADHASSIGSA
jgi:hypothetical protein